MVCLVALAPVLLSVIVVVLVLHGGATTTGWAGPVAAPPTAMPATPPTAAPTGPPTSAPATAPPTPPFTAPSPSARANDGKAMAQIPASARFLSMLISQVSRGGSTVRKAKGSRHRDRAGDLTDDFVTGPISGPRHSPERDIRAELSVICCPSWSNRRATWAGETCFGFSTPTEIAE